MARNFSIITIIIYFIFGQGFAYGWIVCIPLWILAILTLMGKMNILQWLISFFLLWVSFFASPTFGYSDKEKTAYNAGLSDGQLAHDIGGIGDSIDDWWEGRLDRDPRDYRNCKKYFVYGFKRGLDGCED